MDPAIWEEVSKNALAEQAYIDDYNRRNNIPVSIPYPVGDGQPVPGPQGTHVSRPSDEVVSQWRERLVGNRIYIKGVSAALLTIRAERYGYRGLLDGTIPLSPESASGLREQLAKTDEREAVELSTPKTDADVESSDLPAGFSVFLSHQPEFGPYNPSIVRVRVDRHGLIASVD